MKLGFICEGKTEKKIIESKSFQDFLKRLSIDCNPSEIIDAQGKDRLLPKSINGYIEKLINQGADKIIILTDLDKDACITITKQRIKGRESDLIIVAVKTIEAWFLADKVCMSNILKRNFNYENPELVNDAYSEIKNILLKETGRGSNHKSLLASMMVYNGFSIESAANHPNCNSAKYFIEKLKSLSAANP